MTNQDQAKDTVTLPTGETHHVSFGAENIRGFNLTADGALVILLDGEEGKGEKGEDGGFCTIGEAEDGRFVIHNFESLVESGDEIILGDGEVIKTDVLYAGLTGQSPVLANVIEQPAADQTSVYDLADGQEYTLNFDVQAGQGQIDPESGALLISFADNGLLVLENFASVMGSDEAPILAYNGTEEVISLEEFANTLTLAQALEEEMESEEPQSELRSVETAETLQELDASEVADIEPAAGDSEIRSATASVDELAAELAAVEPAAGNTGSAAGGRGGFGFQSGVTAAPLGSPLAIGPIGPTELQFGLPGPTEILFPQEQQEISAQNNPPPPPELEVDDTQVYEDGSVLLDISADPLILGGQVTVTVTGIPSTWGVDPNGGSYDAGTGTWTGTAPVGDVFVGGPILSPPADSDGDLGGLVVDATTEDTGTGLTSSSGGVANITTDAVADTPDLDASDATGNEGDVLPVTITTALNDTDGSETIQAIKITGVPSGFTLSAGTPLGGGEYELTEAELAGLEITPPADFVGTVTLNVESIAEESNKTDTDFDTTNDTASAFEAIELTWLPVVNPPSVLVNGGVDDAIVKEDGSVDVDIVANLDPAGSGNEILTVTVTGIDPSWGFSVPVGTYDAGTGTWTVTLPPGDDLSTVMTFTPPADTDVDLTGLVATAEAFEPATSTTADDTDGFNVIVDAVADTPDLNADNASGEEGTTIPLTITTAATDTDGSEVIKLVKITGVPAGATLTAGTETGPGEWELSTADLPGLGINVPDGVVGTFTLDVESIATEAPVSDTEDDFSDNEASAFDSITLTVGPDDVPEITDTGREVDETDMVGGVVSTTGTLPVDFGADAPGTIETNGDFTSSTPLTSDGVPVMISNTGTTYTGTAGGVTVFTLEIDPATGDYTFTQEAPLDHPDDMDPDDAIDLFFGAKATDSEGDMQEGTITITVRDDAPDADDDSNTYSVSDGGTGGNVITGLNGGPGADDAESEDNPNTVTEVSFGATTVIIPDGGSNTIDGDFGTLELFSDGSYTYTVTSTGGTTSSLSPGESDVAGFQNSFTKDGITVTASGGTGDLTWRSDSGSGIGIDNGAGDSSTKVFPAGETLEVSFDPADTVTVTLADIGVNNGDDAVDFNIYLASDPGTPIPVTIQMEDLTIVDERVEIVLNASDFGAPGDTIVGFDVFATTEPMSFLLHDVQANHPAPECLVDEFVYTLQDADGDTDTAILELNGKFDPVDVDLAVNNGIDDANVKEDGSVFIPVKANVSGGNGNEALTITIDGVDPSWDLTGTGWSATGTPGQFEITLPAGTTVYNDGFTLTPPAQSDVDLSGLVVTATTSGPDTGDDASSSDGFNVIVDAVADDPNVDGLDNSTTEGQPIDVNVSGSLGVDTDGSEVISGYEISGVPTGFTFNQGTNNGGGVWSFTPAELAGLTLNPNDSNFSGSVNLTVKILTTEDPVTDGETDNTDNDNSDTDVFTLSWSPDINPPSIEVNNGADNAIVKEDGSVDVPITAALGTNPAPGEFLTVTVTGIPSSWGFSAPIGTYNAGTGTWTVTLPAGDSLSTMMTFTPPADSDVDLSGLSATVVSEDPGTGLTANASDSFGILTDAVIDTPTLSASDVSGTENSTIALNISTAATDTDGSERISLVKITGVPAGASLTAGTQTAPGEWELSTTDLPGLGLVVPNGSEGTYTLMVESTATEAPVTDGENDFSDNETTVSETITVTVTDDSAPDAVDDTDTVGDTGTTSGSVIPNDDLGDDTPTTVTAIKFNGNTLAVPATGTVTIDGVYGTLEIAADGSYTYTAFGGADGVDEFCYVLTDNDGDSDEAFLTITVSVDDVPQITQSPYRIVDETNIEVTRSGTLQADFGNDGPGTFSGNDTFGFSGSLLGGNLTSGGVPVDVSQVGNTYTGTAGGDTIFTMTIQGDGFYVFKLIGTLDHADGSNPDDTITLTFGFDATDQDGDKDSGTITVDVRDDAPSAIKHVLSADESDLDGGPIVIFRKSQVEFGEDGPGTVRPTGTVKVLEAVGGADTQPVTVDGAPVDITVDGNGYVAKLADGTVVFTLEIDPNTGDYTYTQFHAIDHYDPSDTNEVLWIKLGAQVVDADGDTVDFTIQLDIADDAPVAHDDMNTYNTADGGTDGNVITGQNGGSGAADDLSEDEDNTVTKISFGGVAKTVPDGGSTTIDGDHGTLKIYSNGDYEYTLSGGGIPTKTEDCHLDARASDVSGNPTSFTKDGITISVGTPLVSSLGSGVLTWVSTADGSGIGINSTGDNGSDKVWKPGEVLEVSFAHSASTIDLKIADIGANNTGSGIDFKIHLSDGSVVSHEFDVGSATSVNGVITISLDAKDFGNGSALIDQVDVFSIKDTSLSAASFMLNDVHAECGIPLTKVHDKFVYTLADADSDTDTAILALWGEVPPKPDDQPVARNDSDSADGGETVSGNVTNNDDLGDDTPTTVTKIRFGNQTVNVPSSGQATIEGDYGTLKIRANGSYTYEADNDDGVDKFTYTLTDEDGDSDTAKLTITVDADDQPVARNDYHTYSTRVGDADGNVITGENGGPGAADTLSNDGGNVITKIKFGGVTKNVPNGGSTTIDGDHGTLKIYSNGDYDYTFTGSASTSDTVVSMNPGSSANGRTSYTKNGITVSIADPASGALVNSGGTLTWFSDGHGAGIGIKSSGGGEDEKVWKGEVIRIDLESGASELRLTLADVGPNNDGNAIFATFYLSNGQVVKRHPTLDSSASGLDNMTFSAENIGNGNGLIEAVTLHGWHGAYSGSSSLLLNNVKATYPGTPIDPVDVFTYTLTDIDGDKDTAKLTLEGLDVGKNNPNLTSPLVLDLDGDGVELVSIENGILFDMTGQDGVADQTGWIGADDGLLVLDKNGDGAVNDNGELFGTDTTDGFTVLAGYDVNADGAIDTQDEVFADLRVWQDTNQDGVSQAGELYGLADLGIASIGLDSAETHMTQDGNLITHEGAFTYEDGEMGEIVDAWFSVVDGADELQDAIDDFVYAGEDSGEVAGSSDGGQSAGAVSDLQVITSIDIVDTYNNGQIVA